MSLEEDLSAITPDPANRAPYPRGLALDLVLEVAPLKEVLESYGIAPEQFASILANPAFRQEYEAHRESMQTEGWSFRKKCQAQAELYLGMVFRLANNESTPAAVRADLIKNTVKWAGLDSPKPVGGGESSALVPVEELSRKIRSMPDEELELRVTQMILKRPQKPPTPTGVTYDNE